MNYFNMLPNQARQMQEKLLEEQKKLEETEVTGTAGGGLVQADITCKHVARRVRIDPSLITREDATVLEELLVDVALFLLE